MTPLSSKAAMTGAGLTSKTVTAATSAATMMTASTAPSTFGQRLFGRSGASRRMPSRVKGAE